MTKSKAYEQGIKDGAEKVRDVLFERSRDQENRALPRSEVEGWFAPGQMGADEAWINAMGADAVAAALGVKADDSDGWNRALDDYNAGFRAGALRAAGATE